jgi:hypothetical protein
MKFTARVPGIGDGITRATQAKHEFPFVDDSGLVA